MSERYTPTSIRLPAALRQELDDIARQKQRSRVWLVRYALERFVAQWKRSKPRKDRHEMGERL